jgi:hypothetical protein
MCHKGGCKAASCMERDVVRQLLIALKLVVEQSAATCKALQRFARPSAGLTALMLLVWKLVERAWLKSQ